MSEEVMKLALEALEAERDNYQDWDEKDGAPEYIHEAITALREALTEQSAQQRTEELLEIFKDVDQCGPLLGMGQPAQQEPVAKVRYDLDGHIGWNPNLRQLPDEGTALYTSPSTLSLAQRPHECSRSHPHENMNAMCELRTEIARLTNENARLKAQPAQRKPLTDDLDVKRLNHCMIAVRDWLGGGCDTNDIPRPEIAALVAFTDYGIKENT